MQSRSLNHFPQITYKGDEKLLWNPILKKGFKNLPEERVRLKLVEYLIEEASFSKHRISFESPVHLPRDKSNSRTDLICYDNNFEPLLLVECKSPEVKLDAKVALQIARYNIEVGAPNLMVTNGKSDFWFKRESDNLELLDDISDPFKPSITIERKFEYWTKRGFAGKNSHPDSRNWIVDACLELYNAQDSFAHFFSFEGTSPELSLPNYYRVYPTDENTKLALSLTSTPYGATKLNAVLNHEGDNIALLSISLDLLASEEPKNALLQSKKGIEQFNMMDEIGFSLEQPLSFYPLAFADLML